MSANPPSSLPPSPTFDHPHPNNRGAYLFEISWEVCNQVGGIYTVLRSKVPSMRSRWADNYCLIGPYNPAAAQIELDPQPPPSELVATVEALQAMGIGVHTGRWLVRGRPNVLLLDYRDVFKRLAEIKYLLWEHHDISMPGDDQMIDEVTGFGEIVRLLLEIAADKLAGRFQILAHFHEWMSGVAIPELRRNDWRGGIIFTTHATLLGRYLASAHPVFYDHLPFFNADQEAEKFNIVARHKLECAAAHGAHVFTTVSDVTAQECTSLLGRSPDLISPNGLNITRFAALHEFQNLHLEFKNRIHEFTMGHFFPSYSFDLERTLYFYTSGRYEYRNKGMDLTLEALARLNARLKAEVSPMTVVFFLVTKAPTRSINVRALESRSRLAELKEASEAIGEQVTRRLFLNAASGGIPDLNALVEDHSRMRLRRTIHAWRSGLLPPIVTHDLQDDGTDAILNKLRECQLFNSPHDPVKVVYHPTFITATDPLFNMEYEQFVRGCHLGIFPSYYEPWGYTPLESIALGVPAITSDLAGFGSFVESALPECDSKGVFLLRRRQHDENHSADDLCTKLLTFCRQSRRERIAQRNRAEDAATLFDWHKLDQYQKAHELARGRATGKSERPASAPILT